MKRINLRDANQQFSKLVRQVQENGDTFVVVRNGHAAAQLGPVQKASGQRALSATQQKALKSLLQAARTSRGRSEGERWTREELYERD